MAGRVARETTLADVRDILQAINPLLVPLATESTAVSIDSAVTLIEDHVKPEELYYSENDTISTDTNYTVPFSGRNLIFYSSKALIVRLNDAANDPIPLQANIGLKVDGMVITSVRLTSVQANTDIKLIVTGR